MVSLWLGLAMVGVEAALINHNLRQSSLLHCVAMARPRAMVYGAELTNGKGRGCVVGQECGGDILVPWSRRVGLCVRCMSWKSQCRGKGIDSRNPVRRLWTLGMEPSAV